MAILNTIICYYSVVEVIGLCDLLVCLLAALTVSHRWCFSLNFLVKRLQLRLLNLIIENQKSAAYKALGFIR